MHYLQAMGKIKQGLIYPFYLFSGPEKFLQEKVLQEIHLCLQQKEGKTFFLERLEGAKLSLPELMQDMRQTTIFSGGRLLWIQDPPYFSAKKRTAQTGKKKKAARQDKPAGEEELLAFSQEEEVSDLVVVFAVSGVDRRKKLVKTIEAGGRLVEFPLLRGAALKKWVRDELSLEKKQIEEEALAELLERVGENLQLLQRELDKMVTYLGKEKMVTRSLIERLVPESSQGNIFHLVEAVGRQNVEEALFHLHKMRLQNEPPLVILAMIARQFRLLYQYLIFQEKNMSLRELAAALKLPPFIIKGLANQAQNYNPAILARIISSIKEMDLGIKTGRYEANEALERLILQLTNSRELKKM
jgi:DNA polymerase-3 subunit delta